MTVGTADLVADHPAWSDKAACRDQDPDLFHDRENHEVARAICHRCPVQDECLTEGEKRSEDFQWAQTWGGELFTRNKKVWRNKRRGEIQDLVTCPACNREIGAAHGRFYPEHKRVKGGLRCPNGGVQFRFGMIPSEYEIMERVKAGATRRALHDNRRVAVERMKRDMLLVANERGGYTITPEGQQAIDIFLKERQAHGIGDEHQRGEGHEDPQPAPDRDPGREGGP